MIGVEQGAPFELAMDIDQSLTQLLKSGDRNGHSVDLGNATPLGRESPRDDQVIVIERASEHRFDLGSQVAVSDLKNGGRPGLSLARTYQVGRCLAAQHQTERR